MTVLALHTEAATALPVLQQPVRKAIPAGQLLVGGRWVDVQPSETMDVTDPTTEASIIKAGTMWLNTWHKYHPNAPFGGTKMSAYGRAQGAEALENYTQYKTVWANLGGG